MARSIRGESMKTRLRGRAPKRGAAHRSRDPRSARTGATGIQTTAGCTLALGHETTPIGEMHPALGAGWNRVGVPGWVPPDLTLDSNDLTRLHGFDAREAGGCERQQVFQAVRLRGAWAPPLSERHSGGTVSPHTRPVKPARSSPAVPPWLPRVADWKA